MNYEYTILFHSSNNETFPVFQTLWPGVLEIHLSELDRFDVNFTIQFY